MSKLSFRARALDASKPMPIYLAEELPDLPDYSAINRAVPQMPSGMEKEEESEHHLQRAISGTGLIIPTPEVCQVMDLEFYERCYPADYKMPKQHIHMQPLWEEQEAPEYDIDSEDERWLKQRRHPELTELKFEQMMDKLEKSSGQTVVTLNEAKLLLERHDDLVTAVYDYWLNKRLNTQHALILSVKTEHRLGQPSNNPYLAFRRRTEKMQTRKNRKNDESSYEKMLKLRRDLARALSLLEMVARREQAKRELVRLTALIAERRYAAGDFANHLLPEPPPRPAYTAVSLTSNNFRREPYSITHYPPRPPPTPVDQPRQREKRSYKRRKHRYPAVGSAHGLRDSGVYTSSEEESGIARVEPASPPDDGPFAFRRKPGCYYEMPTSTLCGDPMDTNTPAKESVYEHELDERSRYTLTSVRSPYSHCIGYARRRATRGGRVALDRLSSPLDDLWPKMPFRYQNTSEEVAHRREEVELETKAHRTPKEITRDYVTCCKYPWRRAFRKHLARKPEFWICPDVITDEVKPTIDDLKPTIDDLKPSIGELRPSIDDLKPTFDELKPSLDNLKPSIDVLRPSIDELRPSNDDLRPSIDDLRPSIDDLRPSIADLKPSLDTVKLEPMDVVDEDTSHVDVGSAKVYSAGKVASDSARTSLVIDDYVRNNLDRVMRKRSISVGTDSSYDSDESLHPVEKEFEKFVDEVNTYWLHFRPKTPTPPPSTYEQQDDHLPLGSETPFNVELVTTKADPFLTGELNLTRLDATHRNALQHGAIGDELFSDTFTGSPKGPLSDSDLMSVEEDDQNHYHVEEEVIVDEYVNNIKNGRDSFLLRGQSPEGRAGSGPRKRKAESFGSSAVTVREVYNDDRTIYVEVESETNPPNADRVAAPKQHRSDRSTAQTDNATAISATTVVSQQQQDVGEMPAVKVDKRKKEADVVSTDGNTLTVRARHSPAKKQQGGALGRRPSEIVASPAPPAPVSVQPPLQVSDSAPQIVTVAVSDTLKVRLQNHLLSTQAGVLVQNGPFPPVAVALPVQQARDTGVSVGGVTAGSSASPRRVSAPLVHLAPASLAHKHLQIHPQQHAAHPPLVVAPPHTIHHVAPNKLKVLHAHSLTHSQRTQLLAQNRVTHLPTVVSLATLADPKTTNTALIKAASGSVAQLFEIKSGQLGKGPHLVNVVRQQQAPSGKTTVTRLDLNNDKKRQVVTAAAFDGQLKGNVATATRPQRVSLSLDGRQIVRTALPSVRASQVRHQIQLKNRTLQVTAPPACRIAEPSTSITIAAPGRAGTIPTSMVANLLHKNVQLPKTGQKIAISGPGGQPLSANVQAIAFTTAAQIKARQARLIAQPRQAPVAELVEASSVVGPSPSTQNTNSIGSSQSREPPTAEDGTTNGSVGRRSADTLPMEVT